MISLIRKKIKMNDQMIRMMNEFKMIYKNISDDDIIEFLKDMIIDRPSISDQMIRSTFNRYYLSLSL